MKNVDLNWWGNDMEYTDPDDEYGNVIPNKDSMFKEKKIPQSDSMFYKQYIDSIKSSKIKPTW